MKTLLLTIISILTGSQLDAQHLVKSDKYKISFLSTEPLKKYDTESDSVLGYENKNYAVDIDIVPIASESKKFIQNLKYGAKELATQMDFKNIMDGGKIATIEESYYVLGYYTDKQIPVYVIVILNYSKNIIYEITVYCYNLNKTEGEKITQSFSLLK